MPGPTVHYNPHTHRLHPVRGGGSRRTRRRHQAAINRAARRARHTRKFHRAEARSLRPRKQRVQNLAKGKVGLNVRGSGRQAVKDISLFHPSERSALASGLLKTFQYEDFAPPKELAKYLPKKRLPELSETIRANEKLASERKQEVKGGLDQGSDLERAVEFGTLFIPGAAVGKLGKLGFDAVRAARAAKAAETAARGASVATKAGRTAEAARAAKAVEAVAPKAAKVTERVAAKAPRATSAVRKATAPVRFAGRHSGKAFGASLGAPLAVGGAQSLQAGNLGPLRETLATGGTVGKALHDAGGAVSSVVPGTAAQNIVRDAFDLPANALPSTYLLGAGVVEAAQGDSSKLNQLWTAYKDTGVLPALFGEGDALKRIENHPLFSALELSGARAVAGRTAGIAGRTAGVKAASTARAPLQLGKGAGEVQRRYSPDVIEKAVQVARDRSRAKKRGGQFATDRERTRYLSQRLPDRLVATQENVRRAHRAQEEKAAIKAAPSRKGRVKKANRDANRTATNLAVQGIIRSERTFVEDVRGFRQKLAAAREGGDLSGFKMRANRELDAKLRAIEKHADPQEVFASVAEHVPAMHARDREIAQATGIPHERLQQARLIPYARIHMGAKHGVTKETKARIDEFKSQLKRTDNEVEQAALRGKIGALSKRKQIVDSRGNALKPSQIEAHIAASGREHGVGFVSQQPPIRDLKTGQIVRRPGSYYKAMFPRKQAVASARRTGKAAEEGTFDPSYEALVEQRVRSRGIVDATEGFNRTIAEVAAPGKFKDWKAAEEAARNPAEHGLDPSIEWKPVRLSPLGAARDESLRAQEIFDQLNPAEQTGIDTSIRTMLEDATREGEGPVVLAPAGALDRLSQHVARSTTFQRSMQVISSSFKRIVLPFSPKWIPGNFADMSLRSMFAGTLPSPKVRIGGRALNDASLAKTVAERAAQIDRAGAERAVSTTTGGTLFESGLNTRVYRDARQFADTRLAPLAASMGALRRAPTIKQTVNVYGKLADGIMNLNSKIIEEQPQWGALGKAMRRDVQDTTDTWHHALMVGPDAIEDLARGFLNTRKQIHYAEQVEQVYGKWQALGPDGRRFLVDYAPFGLWLRAATRFVILTLPAKHPIKTAVIAAAFQATDEQRKAVGLSLFAKDPLPPYLQGSLPLEGGGIRQIAPLTSFGIFNDYASSVSSTFLPQFGGLDALRGLDWKGDKLIHKDGTPLSVPERAGVAMLVQAEAFVPFAALGQKISGWNPNPGDQTTPKGLPGALNPVPAITDKSTLKFLRDLAHMQEIGIPAEGSSSSSSGGAPWKSSASSSGTAPWKASSSSAGSAPWK